MQTAPHRFAGRQTLVLSMPEVKRLLSMAEGITLQRMAFEAHAQGKAWNAPNTWLPVRTHGGWMKLLAGFVESTNALGIKVVARYPQHPPGQNFLLLLRLKTVFCMHDKFSRSLVRYEAVPGTACINPGLKRQRQPCAVYPFLIVPGLAQQPPGRQPCVPLPGRRSRKPLLAAKRQNSVWNSYTLASPM